jgi:hypothetical protein
VKDRKQSRSGHGAKKPKHKLARLEPILRQKTLSSVRFFKKMVSDYPAGDSSEVTCVPYRVSEGFDNRGVAGKTAN